MFTIPLELFFTFVDSDAHPSNRIRFRRDSVEQQREYIDTLRQKLTQPDSFREVYNYTFDYAKEEGQKSMRTNLFFQLSLFGCYL